MAKRKMSENSLKNLEKGKATQYKSGDTAAKINGQKGGLQFSINNKERKLLKEICEIVGEQTDDTTGETNKVAMVRAMYIKAKGGDVNAFNTLRDTMGEKPTDKQEINTNQPAVLTAISEQKIEEVLKRVSGLVNE